MAYTVRECCEPSIGRNKKASAFARSIGEHKFADTVDSANEYMQSLIDSATLRDDCSEIVRSASFQIDEIKRKYHNKLDRIKLCPQILRN